MTLSTPSSGHAPALPGVTRRSLLGAPVVLAAGALPAMASRAPDPLLDLLAQRARAEQRWHAFSDSDDDSPETEAAWREFLRLEDLIEETVATSPEGLAAQIEYMKASYGHGLIEPPPIEEQRVSDVPYAFLDVILEGLGRIGQ